MKKRKYFLLLTLVLLWVTVLQASAAEKQTIYNSPYVSWAPDGKAWTTHAGDKNYVQYEKGTRVTTSISSALRALRTGEHYYKEERSGDVPVGYWQVEHQYAQCIHNNYPEKDRDYHGIIFGRKKCFSNYFSGWIAYCADCNEPITDMLMYMSEAAAESIDYLEMGVEDEREYYYLCPFCTNLEQGVALEPHKCRAISWNEYRVEYDSNVAGTYGGYMADSLHMYNNATEYKGEQVTPVTHLTKNNYTRLGYEFVEWNTKPDGTGTSYQDAQKIFNLSVADWNNTETWTEDDNGNITLYAQWRPSTSTLKIDAAGGTYQGEPLFTLTQKFLSVYPVDNTAVKAPAGFTVSFDTNGGEAISPIQGTRHFTEWSINPDYKGDWHNNVYAFIGPDGSVDTLRANYAHDAVTLPSPSKPGSSFGGWYFDEAFRHPAGGPGDTIVPDEDLTLHAQWVELTLDAKDNYRADGGKGAVDLSWKQPDGRNKSYLLYQSRTGVDDWTKINAANDIGNNNGVKQSFAYTGQTQTYTVPYTGLYTISAEGAQGGNYGNNQGGKGGKTTAKVWLSKGEVLTYRIGGQNGYNGGGSGNMFANGGGSTVVSTDKKGTILIAGGGGGAASMGNGNAGGSNASVTGKPDTSGASGQNGGAGGGGGYQGGSAGELIVHHHTDACYRDTSKDLIGLANQGLVYRSNREQDYWDGNEERMLGNEITELGTRDSLIATEGCTNLKLAATQTYRYSNGGDYYLPNVSYVAVYDQNGNCIWSNSAQGMINWAKQENQRARVGEQYGGASFDMTYTTREQNDLDDDQSYNHTIYNWLHYDDAGNPTRYGIIHGNQDPYNFFFGKYLPNNNLAEKWLPEIHRGGNNGWWGDTTYYYRYNIPIPEGTTGIYIYNTAVGTQSHGLPASDITYAYLSGGKQLICGYSEGQVISSKPAYGGSNYINTQYAYSYTEAADVRTGNGAISVVSEQTGFQETLSLNDVRATDFAAPDAVAESGITKTAQTGNQVVLTWTEPADNGTDYYHKAESYLMGSMNPLCTSNVTKNNLKSGIKGYYYLIDGSPDTAVSGTNGSFTGNREMTVTIKEQVQYLHLAAVDVAGNISPAIHIRLDAMDMLWKLYTRQLTIAPGENVYAGENKTWYVRADGETPFTLQHDAYMDGEASLKYQPNDTIYETVTEGETARNIIFTPSMEIKDGELKTEASQQTYHTEGRAVLEQYPYSVTVRSEKNRRLSGTQKWTLSKETSGKKILVLPVCGAHWEDEIIYSDHAQDEKNSITIIADGETPVFSGLEPLEDKELIDRREETITLQITARDELSGVRDIAVEIYNTDNTAKETYTPDASGKIIIDITKDEPIFSGDFIVTATATDNVGNVKEEVYSTTEFALETSVERILEPHDPIFKCGESGILTITTWGYADRVEVEFPREFTELNPDLNTTYVYTDSPKYKQEEQLQFMVPLYAPTNKEFTITVRAYKGDKQLEDYPSLSTIEVDGSILDEIRTRLR